jgi:hypothetical protein
LKPVNSWTSLRARTTGDKRALIASTEVAQQEFSSDDFHESALASGQVIFIYT